MICSIFNYLDNTVETYPDKIGYIDNEREITFANLRNEALCVASNIIDKRIKKKPIVIFMEKGISCIVSFLGAAYSSNFYSPIDTKMPMERIRKITETLDPALVITDMKHLDEATSIFAGIKVLAYENIRENMPIDEEEVLKVSSEVIDTDILYVLFTSGSTGQPKGVIINHRAAIDFVDWISECYGFNEETVFGNQAQLYFDLSIQDVYAPIRNGSTTVLIPNRLYAAPVRVWKRLIECRVNTIVWIPSMLSMFANLDILRNVEKANLKSVLFCGEVMPMKQLNYWIDNYPNTMFANLYGPTECTEACTYYTLDRKFEDSEVLPMGVPCKNCEALILDDDGKIISEPEIIGELLMRGTCLSSGYYGNPEKTKESFVQNPLNNAYPEMVYKTGDLVFYDKNHQLVYVSRKDFQIKIRGYRVELGEIEAAATSVIGIDYACCLFDDTHEQLILVYSGQIEEDRLRKELENRLQEYMIPAKYEKIEKMIFNLNGKIDRETIKKTYLPYN